MQIGAAELPVFILRRFENGRDLQFHAVITFGKAKRWEKIDNVQGGAKNVHIYTSVSMRILFQHGLLMK